MRASLWTKAAATVAIVLVSATSAGAGNASLADPPICGDLNNSGEVAASDALVLLRRAVGQEVTVSCGAFSAQRFGFAGEVPESNTYTANYLLGVQVAIPAPGYVTHLGVIGREAGPHFKVALYADAGGVPSDLVVGSEVGDLIEGQQAIAVPPTSVPAGTYWVMAIFDVDAELPGNNDLANTSVRYRELDFLEPFPASFGDSLEYTGGPENHYVKVIL